jgi:hypothetical protein
MRKRKKLEVSTFPFLAVLLCTMGSLILLLLVIDKQAKKAALEKLFLAKTINGDSKELEFQKIDDFLEKEKALKSEIEKLKLNNARNKTEATKNIGQDKNLETLKRLEIQIAGILKDETVLKNTLENKLQGNREIENGNKTASSSLLRLEASLEELKKSKEKEKATYSIIPYTGKKGLNRKPLYLECVEKGVVFHPDGKLISPELEPTIFLMELESRCEQLKTYLVEQLGDPDASPYLMLLVRPDGISNYWGLQTIIKRLDLDFGYELIDQGWSLEIPRDISAPDPKTLSKINKPLVKPAVLAGNSGPNKNGVSSLINPIAGIPPAPPGLGNSVNSTRSVGLGDKQKILTGGNIGQSIDKQNEKNGNEGFATGKNAGKSSSVNSNKKPVYSAGGTIPNGSGFGNFPRRGEGYSPPDKGGKNGFLPDDDLRGIDPYSIANNRRNNGSPDSSIPRQTDIPGVNNQKMVGRENVADVSANNFGGGSERISPYGGGGALPGNSNSGSKSGFADGNGSSGKKVEIGGGDEEKNKAQTGQSTSNLNGAPGEGKITSDGAQGAPSNSKGMPGQGTPQINVTLGKKDKEPESANLSQSRTTYSPEEDGPPSDTPDAISKVATPLPELGPRKSKAPIPLKAARLFAERDWILFVECRFEGLILHASRKYYSAEFLMTEKGAAEFLEEIQALIFKKQSTVRPGESLYRPQVRFLVWPDGTRSYHIAYPKLQASNINQTRQNLEQEDSIKDILQGRGK